MFAAVFVVAANINVSPPTLPKNISIIRMNCETIPNCEVMPRDSPTVPIADAVSNSDGSNGIFSRRQMIIPQPINSPIYSKKIVAALFTVSSDIHRLKKCVSSFLRNTDSADETKTAMVVVFIPPAVEPG